VRGIPEADDNALFDTGIAMGCVAMAIERIGNLPVIDGRPAGDSSRTQRIATLEAAATVARDRRCLPHLAGWLATLVQALRRRWPDADLDFAGYPPYVERR